MRKRASNFKQFLVPVSIVVKNRKMLLLERRDPRPDFNKKWEFPGGGIKKGEEIKDCLYRETREETGFKVKIVLQLPEILSIVQPRRRDNYQVFLLAYIVTIISGKLKLADRENSGYDWATLGQALKKDLLPLNKKVIQANRTLLKKYID